MAASGVILILLGLFPKLAAVVASIPNAVLGGAGIAMFISSVMLARLKEQSGPLREGKVIEDKIK